MQRALITGIKSFTGSYLKAELEAAGYIVYGTVHRSSSDAEHIWRVDLCDEFAVHTLIDQVKPDVVVHLSAISFVDHDDVSEIYNTNIVGTRNLLRALSMCVHQPRICILVSSANVYGRTKIDPIDECVSVNPMNDYAVSKIGMEYMARLWMDKLPISIVRPFNFTGVGQNCKFLVPKIVDHYRRGATEIELGNLDVARDFSDVRFIAKCIVKLTDIAPSGEIFNLCSGNAVSVADVLDEMNSLAGMTMKVRVNPAFIRNNEVKLLRGSGKKLYDFTGLKSIFSFRDTLSWMFNSRHSDYS